MNERCLNSTKYFLNLSDQARKIGHHNPHKCIILRRYSQNSGFCTTKELLKTTKVPVTTSLSVLLTGYPDLPYSNLSNYINIAEFYKGTKYFH